MSVSAQNATTPGSDEVVHIRDMLRLLQESMAELPEERRHIITERYLAGRSRPEVAKDLGKKSINHQELAGLTQLQEIFCRKVGVCPSHFLPYVMNDALKSHFHGIRTQGSQRHAVWNAEFAAKLRAKINADRPASIRSFQNQL